MDIETIYFLIAAIGCLIGVSGWVNSEKKEAGELFSAIQVVETRLDHLLLEIEDIKAQLEDVKINARECLELTVSAKTIATAAHDRLDSIDIIPAHQAREEKNKKTTDK